MNGRFIDLRDSAKVVRALALHFPVRRAGISVIYSTQAFSVGIFIPSESLSGFSVSRDSQSTFHV